MKPRNSFAAALARAQNAERSAPTKGAQRQLSPRPQGAVAAAAAALASLPKFSPPITPNDEQHKCATELYFEDNPGAALAVPKSIACATPACLLLRIGSLKH